MTNIIINGASGTMGKVLAELVAKFDDIKLVAGVDRFIRKDASFPIYSKFEDSQENCDVIIDFSLPEALPLVIEGALKRHAGLVIATTGLTENDYQKIEQASKQIPIFIASNMSLGVNLQISLIRQAASVLGENFDIEIIEKHHNQKVDAPSGTALTLAEEISKEFLEGKEFVYDRHAIRKKREKREIGLHAVRGGSIVGEHQVLFLGEDEVLEITHIAHSKKIFALGALKAAGFIANRAPQIYNMNEMLAEETSVTKVGAERNQSIVSLHTNPKFMADVFDQINHINIDMISQTMPALDATIEISFTLNSKDLEAALEALGFNFGQITHQSGLARFTIEGPGMEHKSGIAAGVFRALTDANITILLVTTSETKISFCIDEKDVDAALETSQRAFNI